jgi:hypothetical protein
MAVVLRVEENHWATFLNTLASFFLERRESNVARAWLYIIRNPFQGESGVTLYIAYLRSYLLSTIRGKMDFELTT